MQQLDFWNKFKNYVRESDTKIRLQSPRHQHWYDISIGSSDAHIALTLNSKRNLIGCGIYINKNKDLYNYLYEQKSEIEKDLNEKVEWVDAAVASRIIVNKEVSNVFSHEESEEFYSWLYEKTIIFQKIFAKLIKEFKK